MNFMMILMDDSQKQARAQMDALLQFCKDVEIAETASFRAETHEDRHAAYAAFGHRVLADDRLRQALEHIQAQLEKDLNR